MDYFSPYRHGISINPTFHDGIKWVIPEKIHTLPTEEISANRRGRGEKIVHDIIFMFNIFWSFSRPIVAILRSPTVKGLLSAYRYFFKRFLASLCEGNSKDCELSVSCFGTSVQFYFAYCPNICSLTFHFIQNNFKNIFSQDLIG